MKFLRVTHKNLGVVYVNPSAIATIESHHELGTVVRFVDGNTLDVQESPERLLEALGQPVAA